MQHSVYQPLKPYHNYHLKSSVGWKPLLSPASICLEDTIQQ